MSVDAILSLSFRDSLRGLTLPKTPRWTTRNRTLCLKKESSHDSNHRDLSLRYLLFHRGVAVAAMSTQQREQKNEKAKPEKP